MKYFNSTIIVWNIKKVPEKRNDGLVMETSQQLEYANGTPEYQLNPEL